MSNFIYLETVGCDDHHNRRIAELGGSLQLRDYPADIVRLRPEGPAIDTKFN
jgi:hypothetical protein